MHYNFDWATEPCEPPMDLPLISSTYLRYLENCNSKFKPVLYRRYVDDNLCLFKTISVIWGFSIMLYRKYNHTFA